MSDKKKVIGIGGIFFKSSNVEKLQEWYKKYLGFEDLENWGKVFETECKDSNKGYYTVWGTFKDDTKYFDPGNKPYMINYIVEDLEWVTEELKKDNIEISEIEVHDEGKFAWLVDPEGTKLELWEPK